MNTVTAMLAVTLSCLPLACARVQPGLANVPANPVAPSVYTGMHDAIANGPESCARIRDPGASPYRIPPCPTSPRRQSVEAAIPGTPPLTDVLPVQWLEHYHTRRSCRFGRSLFADAEGVGWATLADEDGRDCALP